MGSHVLFRQNGLPKSVNAMHLVTCALRLMTLHNKGEVSLL